MKKDAVKGRAVYVLIMTVLLNMLYPITSGNSFVAVIIYEILYAGLFILGIFVTSDSRAHIAWSVSIAVIWFIAAVIYSLDPTNFWKTQITYIILVIFHINIILEFKDKEINKGLRRFAT